jgi:FtsH-binding integral membrane protein
MKGDKLLKTYGWTLIAFFCGCLYTLWCLYYVEDHPMYHEYFGITISLWYLITGIGILVRRQWGYYLFKLFLYVLLLAFPIGTIISYKTLTYIKKNNIRSLFSH